MRKFTKDSITHFVKGLVGRWNVQKMRSESSEYVRKTTGFFTVGEATYPWRAILKSMPRKFGREKLDES